MLTADTITDEQIRELLAVAKRESDGDVIGVCYCALSRNIPARFDSRQRMRARCAEILNARGGK